MKTAICYYSRHHGNTLKVLEGMVQGKDADLIDVTTCRTVCLEPYDCVGLASGIYYGKFQKGLLRFARKMLPEGKPVFFVCTYGILRPGYTKAIRQIAQEKSCPVLGEFGCRGYDTFGPFRLIGGIAKNRPNGQDLEKARSFYRTIQETHHGGGQL